MQCLDVRQNLHAAGLLGSAYFRMSHRHRQRASDNISQSFPDWSSSRVDEVAERSFQHMVQLFLIDALAMPRLIMPSTWPMYVRLGEFGPAIEHLVEGKASLLVTGHVGNWELLGFGLGVVGFPIYALARPLDNPLVNDWIMGVREARGLRVITKWGATPILQELMTTGGRVGFIADQNAGDQGLFVPFFGRLASTYKSVGLLAMRYNVPVICGCAMRLRNNFEYRIEATDFIRPEEWSAQPDPLFYITARFSRAMEAMIRMEPGQYLWVHRRWKSRPRHERQGKPVPSRVLRQLESLPWMTQRELDRIVSHSNEQAARMSKDASAST